MSERRKALGRGLEALIPRDKPKPPDGDVGLRTVSIEDLRPQDGQPRQYFDSDRLEELAASIRVQGIIQPIVTRKVSSGRLEIIAGERRWRAAQKAGLREVPVIVRETSSAAAFELALIENLQREDLNPMETAQALERLMEDQKLSHEQLAERVGKDRSTVANTLRLLKLPASVRAKVATGELSGGHARTLLGCSDPKTMVRLAERVLSEGMSVRTLEALVRLAEKGQRAGKKKQEPSASVKDLVLQLQRSLGTKVSLTDRKGKGKLHVSYTSYDDLDRILQRILG